MKLALYFPLRDEVEASGHLIGYTNVLQNIKEAMLDAGVEFTDSAQVAFHVSPPHMFQPMPKKFNILNTMWEGRDLPPRMARSVAPADMLIVPSTFCRTVFSRAGFKKPIAVVPLGIWPENWPETPPSRHQDGIRKFLWVGSRDVRKGWQFASEAWIRAFTMADPAALIVKTSSDPGETRMRNLQYGRVSFLTHKMSYNELTQLYLSQEVFICTSVGEGFGLCVSPETLIQVQSGGVKTMAQLMQGDIVLAGDGKFHRVMAKVNRVAETMHMKCHGAPVITVTPEHPFLRLPRRADPPTYYSRHPLHGLSWTRADELQVGDYVATPRPQWNKPLPKMLDLSTWIQDFSVMSDGEYLWNRMGYSPRADGLSIQQIERRYSISKRVAEDARNLLLGTIKPHRGGPGSEAAKIAQQLQASDAIFNTVQQRCRRYVAVDHDFMTFIGWYLAEGSAPQNGAVEIDLHAREFPIAEWLSSYVERAFGLKAVVEKQSSTKCRMTVCSTILGAFLKVLCGAGAHHKQLHPILWQSAPSLAPLIHAYFLGDGHASAHHYSLATASETLAWQVRGILATVGIYAQIKHWTHQDLWELHVGGDAALRYEQWIGLSSLSQQQRRRAIHILVTDDYLFVPVKRIQSGIVREVMDISVDGSHDFVGNGILLHNTPLEAMAAGMLVITPRHTGLADFVHSGVAWIVDTEKKPGHYGVATVMPAPKVSHLATLLRTAVTDYPKTAELRARAAAHARTLSWQRCAEGVMQAITRYAGRRVA